MADNISHLQTTGKLHASNANPWQGTATKQQRAGDTCAVLQKRMPSHGPLHVAYEEVLDISMYTIEETQNELDTSSTFWD